MQWEDIMRRVLPPIDGMPPHITSPYGAMEGRQPPSSIPHVGVDFNYIEGKDAILNRSNPPLRSPVAGVVTTSPGKARSEE